MKLRKFEDEDNEGYVAKAIKASILVFIVVYFFPGTIPYDVFGFWSIKSGDYKDWLYIASWLFVWGALVNVINIIRHFKDPSLSDDTGTRFIVGSIRSIIAGVLEEISFRWLIFLGSIVTVKITNYLFFGFLGFGVPQWLHLNVFGPIANFFTLGYLQDLLIVPENWAIGAGLLTANAFFRDGHKYQGLFGVLNSWFAGMFFFWVLFKYGLLACILIHFLYDFIIDVVVLMGRIIHKQVYG